MLRASTTPVRPHAEETIAWRNTHSPFYVLCSKSSFTVLTKGNFRSGRLGRTCKGGRHAHKTHTQQHRCREAKRATLVRNCNRKVFARGKSWLSSPTTPTLSPFPSALGRTCGQIQEHSERDFVAQKGKVIEKRKEKSQTRIPRCRQRKSEDRPKPEREKNCPNLQKCQLSEEGKGKNG